MNFSYLQNMPNYYPSGKYKSLISSILEHSYRIVMIHKQCTFFFKSRIKHTPYWHQITDWLTQQVFISDISAQMPKYIYFSHVICTFKRKNKVLANSLKLLETMTCVSKLFKDTYREKAHKNQTLALTKNANMEIWVIGTSN